MSGHDRLLLVSEPADEQIAGAFVARLSEALPDAVIDTFAPAASFGSVSPDLVRESRARVNAADSIVCLVGASSVAGAWATWAMNTAFETAKPVVCVRLHDDAANDVPPSIIAGRNLPVLKADARAVAAFLERDEQPVAEAPAASTTPLAARLNRH